MLDRPSAGEGHSDVMLRDGAPLGDLPTGPGTFTGGCGKGMAIGNDCNKQQFDKT